ncbi:ABC transporter ATP-binding protein [Paenibacillus sp. KN14-4R]|uniref:ABC transporter ATP-binding protein n=1 Tax=Paenibacillus sp. KN14-4R TaxID=3445773 RepID=UPI003FA013F5
MSQIEISDLTKRYLGDGTETQAVRSINLTLQQNEFTTIVGASGSGKSTLLSLIGTLDAPSSGNILFDNVDVFKLRSNKLADFRFEQIGFVFQQFHLLPTLTALENVMSPLMAGRVTYNKVDRAKQLLEQVGLAGKLQSLPSQLSGGEQQRVAIARALVNEPKWLLADEPTGNLDTENSRLIFELIGEQHKTRQCGVIFVTHDRKLADKADRMIEMKDGEVIRDTGSTISNSTSEVMLP